MSRALAGSSSESETGKLVTRTKSIQLLLLLFAAVLFWWHPITTTFRLAISRDPYTYILMILPISVALIYLEARDAAMVRQSGKWLGALLLALSILLRIGAAYAPWFAASGESLTISMAALVLWSIGSVILCFGLDVFRSLLFPLCFLFLMVPMPDVAVAWATDLLQHQSAAASSMLFHLLGVPVISDGVVLSIPGLTIEVAQECSSIRSSTLLIVMSLILAQLFLQSWWRKVVLVLLAVPFSILKNGIRIVTIAELGTHVNPAFLHGRLHRHGGVIFLSIALLFEIILLWVLRRSEAMSASQIANTGTPAE